MNHLSESPNAMQVLFFEEESLTPSQELFSNKEEDTQHASHSQEGDPTQEDEQANALNRSYHPQFVRKTSVRVRVLLVNGKKCIGNCHVLWPDGRVSDVVNDDRQFLIITDASIEGENQSYSVLTLNKSQIAMLFEIHNKANVIQELA